jgi:hypothetical protein
MEPARSRREARSHQIKGLARWNAKDSSDLHSRADANALQNAQPRGNTTGALRNESGGAVAFPSEWRPLIRSDRLLGLPAADRQKLGCSPAIEGPSMRYPPKHARISGHMSGWRKTHLATKLGELVADGARMREKCAKTMRIFNAARLAVSARGVEPDGSRSYLRKAGRGPVATRKTPWISLPNPHLTTRGGAPRLRT